MTDELSPEDRAMYDDFFKAYGEKHRELSALGPEVSLDVCTVHAIRVMIREAIMRKFNEAIAPRIVSAVGVGVRVKPPEERASLLDQAIEAAKAAPAGRRAEAINAVFETPKLSAEGLETVRAARQAYGVCEWWDEITSQAGELRRFKSSTCGAPEWRSDDHGYREMTLEKWFEEIGRCQCGRVVVIRGEDELEEGGAQ